MAVDNSLVEISCIPASMYDVLGMNDDNGVLVTTRNNPHIIRTLDGEGCDMPSEAVGVILKIYFQSLTTRSSNKERLLLLAAGVEFFF